MSIHQGFMQFERPVRGLSGRRAFETLSLVRGICWVNDPFEYHRRQTSSENASTISSVLMTIAAFRLRYTGHLSAKKPCTRRAVSQCRSSALSFSRT